MQINLNKIATKAPENINKEDIKKEFNKYSKRLGELQNLLYASKQKAVLIILQGMDASGKDGTIKNVFNGINPMGCKVKSFKKPSEEELSYDYLRRVHIHTPQRGMIQIFNRSQYEDILVPSVHKLVSEKKIKERMRQIIDFERMLHENDTEIIKFFLHISPEEQKIRIERRIYDPEKQWKYDPSDITEAKHWKAYSNVYHRIFKESSDIAKWEIIPADDKWYRNYLITKHIVKHLEKLKMKFPEREISF